MHAPAVSVGGFLIGSGGPSRRHGAGRVPWPFSPKPLPMILSAIVVLRSFSWPPLVVESEATPCNAQVDRVTTLLGMLNADPVSSFSLEPFTERAQPAVLQLL